MLVKLVYFSELESWKTQGEPLTGVSFYRFHYGAWAPDVTVMAESLPWIEHKWYQRFYPSKEYRIVGEAPEAELTPSTRELLGRIFERYGRMTAAYVGSLSKQTEPMRAATETGESLDLSMVSPVPVTFVIADASLAATAATFDFSQRGTREEIDERDREVMATWAPLQARALSRGTAVDT